MIFRTQQELREILGEDFEVFAHHFEVKEKGNAPPEGDPHGELDGKNTLIARNPLETTAIKFSISIFQVSVSPSQIFTFLGRTNYSKMPKNPVSNQRKTTSTSFRR